MLLNIEYTYTHTHGTLSLALSFILQSTVTTQGILTSTWSKKIATPNYRTITFTHAATHCNTLTHTATHNNRFLLQPTTIMRDNILQSLQHTGTCTATHCNARQHTTILHDCVLPSQYCNMRARNTVTRPHVPLQHIATQCNTLQHTATHCNTLQHTETHCNRHCNIHCNTVAMLVVAMWHDFRRNSLKTWGNTSICKVVVMLGWSCWNLAADVT